MFASSLPSEKQLNHDTMMIGLVSGVVAGALVAAFIVPVVRFTESQLLTVGSAAVVVAIFWSIYSPFVQGKRLRAIGRFLTAVAEGRGSELSREELHTAFAHACNFPRFMVFFNFSQWVTSGVSAAIAILVGFDAFTVGSAVFIATAATAGGFLSQIIVFIRLKAKLAPCREAIAEWIPDPEVRASLVHPIPLGAKLFVIMAGLMTTSALFSAGISQERSARTLESFSIAQHAIALDRVAEGLDLGDELTRSLETTHAVYRDLGVRFLVLSPDGSEVEIGAKDALLDEEMKELRQDLDGGDSRAFESVNSITWRRLPGDGRVLVAYSSLRELQDLHDRSGWVLVFLSAALVVISLSIARTISGDASSAVSALKETAQRISAGDLGAGRVFESEDEFGDLSRAFGSMSDALRATIREVVTSTRGVEVSTRDIGASSVASGRVPVRISTRSRTDLSSKSRGSPK